MTPVFHYDGPDGFDLKLYYASDAWKAKAAKFKQESGNRCNRCKTKRRLEVHHITYKNIPNEEPGDLIVLCRHCHEVIYQTGIPITKLPEEICAKEGNWLKFEYEDDIPKSERMTLWEMIDERDLHRDENRISRNYKKYNSD